MEERLIKVPLKARSSRTSYNGISVKEAFYTAPYPEESAEAYAGPMNHCDTIVLDGHALKTERDVLLRTGNGLIGLPPRAFLIVDSQEEGGFRVYTAEAMPAESERALLSQFGLFDDYRTMAAIGTGPHDKKMKALLKLLRDFLG